MLGTSRKIAGMTATVALLVAGAIIGQVPSAAMAETVTGSNNEDLTLYAPISGHSQPLEYSSDAMSVRSIGAHHNDFCKMNPGSSDYILRNYVTVNGAAYPAGRTALKCGNSKVGWLHIQKDHASQWQKSLAGLPGDYGDIADFSISQGLGWAYGSVAETGGKTCFIAPIQIKDADDNILSKFWVHVIVSQQNRQVITAYPREAGILCHPATA